MSDHVLVQQQDGTDAVKLFVPCKGESKGWRLERRVLPGRGKAWHLYEAGDDAGQVGPLASFTTPRQGREWVAVRLPGQPVTVRKQQMGTARWRLYVPGWVQSWECFQYAYQEGQSVPVPAWYREGLFWHLWTEPRGGAPLASFARLGGAVERVEHLVTEGRDQGQAGVLRRVTA